MVWTAESDNRRGRAKNKRKNRGLYPGNLSAGKARQRISGTEIGYRYVPHKGAEQALEQQNPMAWIKGFFRELIMK